MMVIRRKIHFTLLELLVVFFIISLGMVLTGVKVKEVYQEQRFLSETQQVVNHLAMAQDLMLMMDTDVHIKFASDRKTNQIQLWLEVEKPLEEHWIRLIERKIPLTAIQAIAFDQSAVKDLSLRFSFGKMSQGKLMLFEGKHDSSSQSDQRQFEIVLQGIPGFFGLKKQPSENQTLSEKSALLYPIEVYEKLYADPNEKKSDS